MLEVVAKAARELGIKWMVTGAAGRVMLLEGVYGLPHGRATEDIDLGVMVSGWDEYHALVKALREDKRFQPDPKQQQRLLYRASGKLDLLPFGEIEAPDRTIRWPPTNDIQLNVMGFREAFSQAIEVALDDLAVPVVGPVGLMFLKLIAWNDRHFTQPKKDAADIAYVLRYCAQILGHDTLFSDYLFEMERAEFDLDLAANRILGQKMATLAAQDSTRYVPQLLDDELQQGTDSRLLREIAESMSGAGVGRTYALVENLRAGLGDELG